MLLVSSCSCLCPIHWSQVLSREWRYSWSSADRRCTNYIWVIDNFIAYYGASYIRDLTVIINLCHAELFWGKWKYNLHFLSFFNNEMKHEDKSLILLDYIAGLVVNYGIVSPTYGMQLLHLCIKPSISWNIFYKILLPFRSNSPRVLKAENWKSCADQSVMTCFSLASISFSFTAEIHTSWKMMNIDEFMQCGSKSLFHTKGIL